MSEKDKPKPKKKFIKNFNQLNKALQNELSWEEFYRKNNLNAELEKSRQISLALKKQLGFIE